jgi:hypothetical protein
LRTPAASMIHGTRLLHSTSKLAVISWLLPRLLLLHIVQQANILYWHSHNLSCHSRCLCGTLMTSISTSWRLLALSLPLLTVPVPLQYRTAFLGFFTPSINGFFATHADSAGIFMASSTLSRSLQALLVLL